MNCNSTFAQRGMLVPLILAISSLSCVHAGIFTTSRPSAEPLTATYRCAINSFLGNVTILQGDPESARNLSHHHSYYKKPVRYRLFNVIANADGQVKLLWITESETDNDRFEVERSFDNANFKTVALVFGHEQSGSDTYTYDFTDKSPDLKNQSVAYYRLKQIDFSGNVYYSDISQVIFPGGKL